MNKVYPNFLDSFIIQYGTITSFSLYLSALETNAYFVQDLRARHSNLELYRYCFHEYFTVSLNT